MERVLKERILCELEDKKLLPNSQHGFRPKRSVATNLLSFYEKVSKEVDNGHAVDVIFYDFAKAFDSVQHGKLLQKLRLMKLNEWIIRWIEDWLRNRKQRVVLNGKFSPWKPVESGVIQGSVLGPVLFICFIADLLADLDPETFANKYADDTKTGRAIKTIKDIKCLQDDIQKLVNWTEKWGLKFNASKCKSLHIGHNNKKH